MSSPYPDKTPGTAVQYAYMFEKDKGPTKQFDALLRAIARYVVRNSLFYVAQDESWCHGTVIGRGHMEKIDILEIGDKSDRHLTPKKLAAFYKAVGGNYD
ncbi:hypothetical protein E4U54_006850, partial [Claviceps lovelessii]